MFIGKSKKYRNILKEIERISELRSDVLIIGESGSGKGVIAKIIHEKSRTPGDNRQFIRVNLSHMKQKELSAILSNLDDKFEETAEFVPNRETGLSKEATIVIEQVETAGYQNQKQLAEFLNKLTGLRILQNSHKVNTRVIVTITEAPSLLVEKNEITKDLAQYLDSFTSLFIPPLRDRKEDIPLLVEHFIGEACKKIGIQEPVLDINALGILLRYPWKNNIRELKAVIERSILFSSSGTFTLPPDIIDKGTKATRLLETILNGDGKTINGSLDTIERNIIDSALKKFEYNISKTAEFLGMSDEHLEYRAYQLGLTHKNNHGG